MIGFSGSRASVAGVFLWAAVAQSAAGDGAKGRLANPKAQADPKRVSEAMDQTFDALDRGLVGDFASRTNLLTRAVGIDPSCQLARWHLGEIHVRDRWVPIAESVRLLTSDEKYAQYRRLRDAAERDPDRELALARWCGSHQFPDAEELHLYRVLQGTASESAKQRATQRLGLRTWNGQLLSPRDITRAEQHISKMQRNLRHWLPIVAGWRKELESADPPLLQKTRAQMAQQADSTSIPALEIVLSSRSETLAREVVTLLATIPGHEATVSLARHGLNAEWRTVRDAAIAQLRQRPLHEYVPMLVQTLTAPIQSQSTHAVRADGVMRNVRQLEREDARATYRVTISRVSGIMPFNQGLLTLDRDDARRISAEQQDAALLLQLEQLANEAARNALLDLQIANFNRVVAVSNDRVYLMLEETTGVTNVAPTVTAWQKWWRDYNEIYQEERPTYSHYVEQFVPYFLPYHDIAVRVPPPSPTRPGPYGCSCFAAGTPVHTMHGLTKIEQVRIGDRVLSQDVNTGELAFKMVVRTTIRPPAELLEAHLGDTVIRMTKGHPVWVNGIGWQMAKEIREDQQIYTIGGARSVGQLATAPLAAAHNLVVADFSTYFVGDCGVLVHDNTERLPTQSITPGYSTRMRERARP